LQLENTLFILLITNFLNMKSLKKCRIHFHPILLGCILFSTGISAQTSILSLKDALTAAEKNYPSIKANSNYVKAADQGIKEARLEYMPSLRLSEQLTYATANSLPGTYFSYGVSVSGTIEKQDVNNPNFGAITALYSEWPVFTFGQNQAKISLAKTRKQIATAGLDNEKYQLSYRTSEAYFDLLALTSLRKSQQQNLQRALALRNIIRSSTITGLKPGVDSSTANAEVSKAKLAYLEALKNEKIQRNYLARLTGIANENIIPDTAFLFRLPTPEISNGNMLNNPLINYYQQRENESTAEEDLVRKNYLPRISILGAAWGRGSGISPESPNIVDPGFTDGTRLTRFNYAIGIGAVFNIADYPRMNAQANEIKYQTLGLQEETNQQKLILQNAVKDADDNFDAALKKAQEAPVLVNAANTAYNQKLAMYNSGLANFTDLAQALYNLNEAEIQNAISYDNVWKAVLLKTAPSGDINILLKQL
jgi:outer membrane protein TolC